MSERKKAWILILVLLGIPSIYGLVLLVRTADEFWDFGAAANTLPEAETRYRAMGLPWVASDLHPQPAVADAENAAPLLVRLAKELHPRIKEFDDLRAAHDADAPDLGARLSRFDAQIALTREAANRPRCDFKRDWDQGMSIDFAEYQDLKRAGQLLCYRAEWSAAQGKSAEAAEDLLAVRRMGVLIGSEGAMISLLVQISLEGLACSSAMRCMAEAKDQAAGLRALRAVVTTDLPPPSLRKGLLSEMYVGVAMCRNLSSLRALSEDGPSAAVDPALLLREGIPTNPKQRAFLARHLEMCADLEGRIKGMEADPAALGRMVDAMGVELEARRGLSYQLEAAMFPIMSQAGAAILERSARLAVADAMGGAMEYRQRHGTWPTKLGDSPRDPFNGKPLRFHLTDDGFRVYSVGKDGKDDGGRTRAEMAKDKRTTPTETWDVVAAFPPVK